MDAVCHPLQLQANSKFSVNEETIDMQLEPIYLTMEKQVIAQMSINLLTRKIQDMAQKLRKENTQRSKRLIYLASEIERLTGRRLKDKFITNDCYDWRAKLIKLPHSSYTQSSQEGRKASISVCDLIKNERAVNKLNNEVNQINTMIKDDIIAFNTLQEQLERCRTYTEEQMPFV